MLRLSSLLFAMFLASALHGGEPVVRALSLRGLQVGGTTTITLDGDDFGKEPRLLFSFPAKQLLKPGGTDKKAIFDVTLDNDAVPGYQHLRLVTPAGVSTPVIIGVDRLPQMPLGPVITQTPAALHGTVAGAAIIETKLMGKAGQKVLVEVEAQRLGSKLRPVLHLYSPKKLQLTWGWMSNALSGDTRIEATLPEDGEYVLALHDVEYNATAPSFFRLKVGDWSCVDQVFPPVVAQGAKGVLDLLGSHAERVEFGAVKSAGVVPLAWPKKGLWAGPRPFVRVSTHAELLEADASKKEQDLPPGEVGVSGKLLSPFEEDKYRVPVTPGAKVKFEVFAERIGSPLDVSLVLRSEKGVVLLRIDDVPGTLDASAEYTATDGVKSILVSVLDAQGRGGPRGIYRLVVEPKAAGKESAEYRLLSPSARLELPEGGRSVFPVWIERKGYQGKVLVAPSGLAKGIKVSGAEIPDHGEGALITLERGKDGGEAGITRWQGASADGKNYPVLQKNHPLERLQPWLAEEIAVAPTSTGEYQIEWRSLPETAALVPSEKLALPVKFTRPGKDSVVKLTLLSSQQTPLLNNQPDPNKALRAEKAVEVSGKALDGEIIVVVPVNLAAPLYDVTVQADWLTPDKKTNLATAFAPVKRLRVKSPLAIKLDGPPRLEAKVDPKKGGTLKIVGKIQRAGSIKGDAVVTLTGLPAALKAADVTVKADKTDFVLTLALPPATALGEIKDVKLSVSAPPNPAQPNVRVKSDDIGLTIVISKSP